MKRFKIITTAIITLLMIFSLGNGAIIEQAAYAADTEITVGNEVGKSYYGFELTSVKDEASINSTIMMFTHVKTGAKLMYIKNEDTQRVFDITFRTPVSDNTGVNHIIEHSVLDGSKNYPSKSPFKEMLKGSLGSFINAMTASDYTTYPVASTNEQDLENLMGVYLDAVFYPNLTTDPNIFKQEGWRYELPSLDSPLEINGVVYNEMKGNYSDPGYLLNNAINQSLFPDSSNKWDSGGNPDYIPSLTGEQLISTYKKNYTPSNSYIYLYGKIDIAKYLKFIDENYLSKFDKVTVDTSIKPQMPLASIPERVASYPISEDSEAKNKTYLSLSYVTGNIEDKEANIALGMLSDLLMGNDNSPLKKALKDKGIAEDFDASFSMSGIQPVFSINAVNSEESSKDIFKETILNTLDNISKNGFDKNYLESTLASYDINKRAEQLVTPMLGGNGLILSQTAISTWIYDKDPTMYFDTYSVMTKIKQADVNKYFQDLINKYLITNNHNSLVILKPEAGLESRNVQNADTKLAGYKNQIGEDGVLKLLKGTEDFNNWQASADSKEALKKLPRLSLQDIKAELPDLSYKVEELSGAKVLTHKADLNGLSSINFYFDTSKVPEDKLHYLSLLSAVLGNVATENHSYDELSNEMSKYLGGQVAFGASAVSDGKNPNIYKPKISTTLLVPEENISKGLDIVSEIINNSKFDDKQKIKQIIEQNKSAIEEQLTSGSGSAAMMAMNSYMSESGRYDAELSGLSYFNFLQDIDNNFDAEWANISKNLKDTSVLAFNKEELVVSFSGSVTGVDIFKKEFNRISPGISSQELKTQKYTFEKPDSNIAYSSSAQVQTILQAGDMKKAGYTYDGKMMVLQNILDMGYLWNKVRTTGGAYGVQSSFSSDGTVILMSMRDPNLKETLGSFRGTVNYLKHFDATNEEMADYIIGAVKGYVNLKTSGPLMEGFICDSLYLTNSSEDDLLNFEKEALKTTPKDIRNYGEMLDKILDQNTYFVEGSKDKIQENKELFNQVIDIEK